KEVEWNILVANEAAKKLKEWSIEVKRVTADPSFVRARIAVAVHFDAAKHPCRSGASVGYPDNNASYSFAQHWKKQYSALFPFDWHSDNFTDNLKHYYAYNRIFAEKFIVLELGELTCSTQRRWLKPRLKRIAHLIAYVIATELGKSVPEPKP
ncbi:MAG: hypothetical protein L3J47_12360, partial [Sulfurovum sp.]|nr:hypothetical protein [Sulfurovum sp.]